MIGTTFEDLNIIVVGVSKGVLQSICMTCLFRVDVEVFMLYQTKLETEGCGYMRVCACVL